MEGVQESKEARLTRNR